VRLIVPHLPGWLPITRVLTIDQRPVHPGRDNSASYTAAIAIDGKAIRGSHTHRHDRPMAACDENTPRTWRAARLRPRHNIPHFATPRRTSDPPGSDEHAEEAT